MDRIKLILQNSKKLNELKNTIKVNFAKRHISEEHYKNWQNACEQFHAQYKRLVYPGDYTKIRDKTQEAIDIALDYLEADPFHFRSGYIKEYLWKYLPQCSLKSKQYERIYKIAWSSLSKTIHREFFYMARSLSRMADSRFWEMVEKLNADEESSKNFRIKLLLRYRP